MTKSVLGIIGGSGIYDLPGLRERARAAHREPVGRAVGGACASATSPACRWCSCRATTRATGCRRPTSTTAPISTCLKRAGVTDLVSLSACGSFKEELPPGTFVLVDQFVDRTHKRESSFFGKGWWRMSRWRIRCRRGCASSSPRRRWRKASSRSARRHLCLHGRPAILDARREPHLQAARLFGDRHDQHAGGQARARGGDLLRHRRHGDRFRLLASRPRRRHRAGHHQGADGERRASAQAPGGAAGARFSARARAVPDRLRPRARHRADHRAGGARSGADQEARRGGGQGARRT